MTNNENPPVAEDLQLEGDEADAVVGGHINRKAVEKQIAHLEGEGYLPDACTPDGMELMNASGKKKEVKFTS
jgi:hypothetical protein